MDNLFHCYTTKIPSWGYLGIVSDETTLLRVDIQASREDLFFSLSKRYSFLNHTNRFKYLAESIIELIHNPVDPVNLKYRLEGTAFQQKVWRAISRIPLGSLKTYQEIANEIGHNKAVRAVGSACGANPLPFIIPCHRVVGSGGRLGGFGLGTELKKKLLRQEGITGFLF
ncbi:MAG: methylated-DNA--[protein]-cysteine S-methyltransferase [Betaproteobacteria bacterium]|nr:methylated-DNA--[protein]-cysteine S-methyltransferase [Betaproteobacteria bacterium]